MTRASTAAALGILAALSLAACAGSGAAQPTPTSPGATASPDATPVAEAIDHPSGPNDLVLRMGTSGGLVAPGWILSDLPTVSIYGDGRVITQGPQIAIYPGPALPNLRVVRVSEAGLQSILAAAEDAGIIGRDAHYDYPGIADAGTTTFVVNARGTSWTVSAYALGLGEDPSVLSPADAAARADLADFAAKLGDPSGWLRGEIVSADEPFRFEAIRVYAQRATPVSPDQGIEPTVTDWPLATPLSEFGAPFRPTTEPPMRCGVVSGDDLATLRPALEAANQLTFWRSGGTTWSLTLRPLLPDEAGCPAE